MRSSKTIIDGVTVRAIKQLVMFILPSAMNGRDFVNWKHNNQEQLDAWIMYISNKK